MEEIEFSRWLFEGRPRQGKNMLQNGLNWLCYFAGNSKSHRENSISFIFLESPHQVDMKNVAKCYKHFFGYFNAVKTHGVLIKSLLATTVGQTFEKTNFFIIILTNPPTPRAYDLLLTKQTFHNSKLLVNFAKCKCPLHFTSTNIQDTYTVISVRLWNFQDGGF